ncbi:hypothetical protein G6F46_007596 [Rhizopus delemar]|uniref:Uncharacterized protein n=2 Tax=Rhizopus TaxID=4842 RepID=A0A9P6Z6J0_9FUNG|nr:hypothetical protein G6F55_006434 [Rhizopus delemar]KAG1541519.1 hypothetical protein G6F51_007842 [Rhizopus arrhizus]KAG1495636.1 hypothetical protein G6F54_007035 [Rhizopus delemar]KAG1509555.1 hypothetical protein G6F53_007358 [Rhizopus delemar]KAG1525074.1 hypothetical protein G6F52_003647 [Rhizopus delemar]
MMAFYQLALLFEALKLPIFNCFPLRRTWIPAYATIDSKILCQNILERWWTNGINKVDLPAELIDMNCAVLKPQELDVLRFRGTIQTYDVGVTFPKKDKIESIDILVFKALLPWMHFGKLELE